MANNMTVSDKTIEFSYSPDNGADLQKVVNVPNGERWYVEGLRIASDGGASSGFAQYSFGIHHESVTPNSGNGETDLGAGGVDSGIDASNFAYNEHMIDRYVSDTEQIIFEDAQGSGISGVTIYVVIVVNQVI